MSKQEYNLYEVKVVIKGKLTTNQIIQLPSKFLLRKGGHTNGVEVMRSWKVIEDTVTVTDDQIKYKNLLFTRNGTYRRPYYGLEEKEFVKSTDFKSRQDDCLLLEGIPMKDVGRFGNKWQGIQQRIGVHEGYLDVTISEKFLDKSFFINWCCKQPQSSLKDTKGKYYEIDKDALSPIVRSYSENTCVFLPRELNNFFTTVRKIILDKFAGVIAMKGHTYKNGDQYYKISVRRKDGACKFLHSRDKENLSKAYREHYCTVAKSLAEKYENLDSRVINILTDLESYINKYKTW